MCCIPYDILEDPYIIIPKIIQIIKIYAVIFN